MIPPLHTYYLGATGFIFFFGESVSNVVLGDFFPPTYIHTYIHTYVQGNMTGAIREIFFFLIEQRHLSTAGLSIPGAYT